MVQTGKKTQKLFIVVMIAEVCSFKIDNCADGKYQEDKNKNTPK